MQESAKLDGAARGGGVVSAGGTPFDRPMIAEVDHQAAAHSPPNAPPKFCLIAFSQKLLIVVFPNAYFPGFVETRF